MSWDIPRIPQPIRKRFVLNAACPPGEGWWPTAQRCIPLAGQTQPPPPSPSVHGFGFGQPTDAPTPEPVPVAFWIVGGVVLLGIGWVIYESVTTQAEVMKSVAAKEGSSGVLKYELGTAAIDVGEAATERMLQNKGRRRRSRRQ